MKNIQFVLFLFLFLPLASFSQPCYQVFYEKGLKAFQEEDFDAAVKSFKAAKVCGDIPLENNVDSKIVDAQNGYIDAIQKERNRVKSLYLAMLARKAIDEGDLLLGFRLSERAYMMDENTTTQELVLNFQENYDKLFRSGRIFKSLKKFKNYFLGEAEDGSVWIFDLNGNRFSSLKIDGKILKVNKTVVSPNEKVIATVSNEGKPMIWDNEGRLIKKLEIHKGPVYDISISSDSKNILTASHDQTAALWTIEGDLIQLFKGHEQPLITAQFSPNGQYILTASVDAKSIVWNRKGDMVGEKAAIYDDPVLQTGFAPDSKNVVAISSSDCVVIYDLEFTEASKREIRPKQSKAPETINNVVISDDGEYVLVTLKNRESFEEMAILYNEKGEIVRRLNQNDLLWTKVPIGNSKNLLVLTKQGKIMLKRLTEKNQKTGIVKEYGNYLRELTEMEKFTYGVGN